MNVLEVYLAKHCLGYEEALRLTEEIEQSFSGIEVKVIMLDDLAEGDLPDIPATPAYFLNGRLLFLGNSRLEELLSKVASLGQDKGGNYE